MAKAKKGTTARPAPQSADAQVSLTREELHRLIEEAAYFKAAARNFAPGHEVQDWIEAESEIRLRLETTRRPSAARSQRTTR
jgi:hypothetical protein